MADLSSYTPIYIRANGNDSTGDGSINAPFLTAQIAFEIAYDMSQYAGGNELLVLDFGIGNFGGVNLVTANASEWPNNIAVRGISSEQSFLGGVNGNGIDGIYNYETFTFIVVPTPGSHISITSNRTINLGNITANGGNSDGGFIEGLNGGNIELIDIVVNNINSNGGDTVGSGNSGAGGTILLVRSIIEGEIISNGGSANGAQQGGSITIIDSTTRTISANGGNGDYGGNGGSIIITNSRSGNITASAGYGGYGNGSNGSIIINNGATGNIIAGTVTFIGYVPIPNSIAAHIDATQLIRSTCVNSTLLGVV
jgi:hypothetical protein